MTTIDTLRAVHANPAASVEDLSAAAAAARGLAASSEADAAALNGRRPGVLLTGSDHDLENLDGGIAAALRTAERAATIAAALDGRAEAARSDRDERARIARYEAAAAAVTPEFRAAIEADYLAGVKLIHGVLERLARADLAIAAVNADLPEGYAPLPSAEGFRMVPAIPSQETFGEPYWLWCDSACTPLAEQRHVKPRPNGMGFAGEYAETDERGFRIAHGVREELVRRLPFRDVTTTRAQHFRNPGALATELVLPALYGGTTPFWSARDAATPGAVLAVLPQRGRPLAPPAPEKPETRRVRINGAERDALIAQLIAAESR